MDLITDLLRQQVHLHPATIPEYEAVRAGRHFNALVSLEILKRVTSPTHRMCPTCGSEMLEVHFVSDVLAFTMCTRNEDSGRDRFNPNDLKLWTLDMRRFLLLFQEAAGIKSPRAEESIPNLLWDLGTQEVNGVFYHLFFCRNIDDIEHPKLSIITALPHSTVFYTGTPHIALPRKIVLVPFADLLGDINKKAISLRKGLLEEFFPLGIYATQEGATELDDDLVLQENRLLFESFGDNAFKRRTAELRPLAGRIIEYLHRVCKYERNTRTLQELATQLESSKVSISNEIKRIKEICAENNLEFILHKNSRDEWAINPHLKCCK